MTAVAAIAYYVAVVSPGERAVKFEQRSSHSFTRLAGCFEHVAPGSGLSLREGKVNPRIRWETAGASPVHYRARNDARHLTLEIEDDGTVRTIRLYLRSDLSPRKTDLAVIRGCGLGA